MTDYRNVSKAQISLIVYILVTITGLLGSYAPNWQCVAVALFFVGFFAVGYWTAFFVGLQEVLIAKRRLLPMILCAPT
jgi:hypothetical protein